MARSRERERWLRFQRWIREWLEDRGWDAVVFPPKVRPIKRKDDTMVFISLAQDVFGCDLVARKIFNKEIAKDLLYPGVEPGLKFKELWIQATLGTNVGRKIDQVGAHPIPRSPLLKSEGMVETHIWLKRPSGEIAVKRVEVQLDGNLLDVNIGKIIRRKFYAAEGIHYEF